MTNWRAQLYNLNDSDLDLVVWRYLTLPKFIGMVSYEALWFPRLRVLVDQFEGAIPQRTLVALKQSDQRWKTVFDHPDLHRQIDEWHERSVDDGRSLTNVNCWFIGEDESQLMWDEYVGSSDGVAVRSTVRQLRENIIVPSDFSFIGRVEYVDHETYQMSEAAAHQAHKRAFLKDEQRFRHENELRVTTMNLRTPACLDDYGFPFPAEEIAGKRANNFDSGGLYVRVNLPDLFDTIVTAPGAPGWFHNLIVHIQRKSGFQWKVQRSTLQP